jgi:uncharacterized protein (DUF302 family)
MALGLHLRDIGFKDSRDGMLMRSNAMSKYGFGKTVASSFTAAVEQTTQALKKEGFGILTDIDVAATLKQKLSQDIPPYRILGACNPPLAHRALQADPSIGLLLPCNVTVREDVAGRVHVEFLDPNVLALLTENPAVAELANEVRHKLVRAMESICIQLVENEVCKPLRTGLRLDANSHPTCSSTAAEPMCWCWDCREAECRSRSKSQRCWTCPWM